jgi:hypothetical protein
MSQKYRLLSCSCSWFAPQTPYKYCHSSHSVTVVAGGATVVVLVLLLVLASPSSTTTVTSTSVPVGPG